MCLMPFFFRNSVNSALTKARALSDTSTSGKPNVANDLRNDSIVDDDVDEDRCRAISSERRSGVETFGLEMGQHSLCALYSMALQATPRGVED